MSGGKRGRKGSLSEVKVVLIRLSRFVRNCHHVYQVRGGGEGQKAEGSASVGFLGNNVIGHCPRATKERSIIFSHQVSGAAGEGGGEGGSAIRRRSDPQGDSELQCLI